MLLISLTLTACALISGAETRRTELLNNCLRLDLERLIGQRMLDIGFGHSIGGDWAVCASSALNFGAMKDKESSDRSLITNSIEMQYWPAGTFTGPMLSLGLESSFMHDLRPFADIGYCCRIWKGVIIGLAYRADLSAGMKTGRESTQGIRVRAYYGF